MKKIFKSPNASPDERELYRKYKEAAATRQSKYRKRKLEDVEEASKVPVAKKTREGFLRKNIVAVSFFQNCAIHQYS